MDSTVVVAAGPAFTVRVAALDRIVNHEALKPRQQGVTCGMSGRVFISHSAKEPAASDALTELSAKLRQAGLDVLLDRGAPPARHGVATRDPHVDGALPRRRRPFLAERPGLGLGQEGGDDHVVGARRSTLTSYLSPSSCHQPPARTSRGPDTARWMSRRSSSASATALADIVDPLHAVIGTNVQTPMEGWVSRLAYVLRNVESRGAGALDRAANAAGLDSNGGPALSKSERLARRLIHAGPSCDQPGRRAARRGRA